ncbi:MAG: dTMP kinase [Acidobacteriota bacterium]
MLIAFEGLDQSGKETQARHLRARIEQDGRKVHALSFPDYDTPIGREIAAALRGERDFSADVMQLLYVANRMEFKPRIDSWLDSGEVVVCDRYVASSVAYGEAQGLDSPWLRDIQRFLPAPTITVLLDIAPETAASRKRSGRDKYERDLGLLARVRESYRRQAAAENWILINGEQPKDAVSAAVAAAVLPRLAPR